jgi:hypothetical protein
MLIFDSVTAVSTGAVLSALNKDKGPARVAQSSFGFLRAESYNPRFTGHRGGNVERCDIDGEEYVDTIKYFIKKVLRRRHTCRISINGYRERQSRRVTSSNP